MIRAPHNLTNALAHTESLKLETTNARVFNFKNNCLSPIVGLQFARQEMYVTLKSLGKVPSLKLMEWRSLSLLSIRKQKCELKTFSSKCFIYVRKIDMM